MSDLRITVTAEDISSGTKSDCEKCAVARAANRARGLGFFAWYDRAWVYGVEEPAGPRIAFGDGLEYSLPEEAIRFIVDFDEGRQVYPFSFVAKEI